VPLQEIALDHGVTVQVDVRDAEGAPLVGAEVELLGRGPEQLRARSDAAGSVRFARVAPGACDVALVETVGPVRLETFQRTLEVGHEDVRIELAAKDGNATLVVLVDSPEPLDGFAQIRVVSRTPTKDQPFRRRGAWAKPDRTEIPLLPATELDVLVSAGAWIGTATVTTIAGQQVEVRVAMKKMDFRRR
jgi:hypothetical protein